MTNNRRAAYFAHCTRAASQHFTPLRPLQFNALCNKIEAQARQGVSNRATVHSDATVSGAGKIITYHGLPVKISANRLLNDTNARERASDWAWVNRNEE